MQSTSQLPNSLFLFLLLFSIILGRLSHFFWTIDVIERKLERESGKRTCTGGTRESFLGLPHARIARWLVAEGHSAPSPSPEPHRAPGPFHRPWASSARPARRSTYTKWPPVVSFFFSLSLSLDFPVIWPRLSTIFWSFSLLRANEEDERGRGRVKGTTLRTCTPSRRPPRSPSPRHPSSSPSPPPVECRR